MSEGNVTARPDLMPLDPLADLPVLDGLVDMVDQPGTPKGVPYAFASAEEALDAIEVTESLGMIDTFSKSWGAPTGEAGPAIVPVTYDAQHQRDLYAALEAEEAERATSRTRPAMQTLEALVVQDGAIKRGMSDSSMLGSSGYERNERDLYSTEVPVTEALCAYLKNSFLSSNSTVWEPACGEGAMVDVIKKHFRHVIASDIVPLCDDGFEADFLRATPKQAFDAILTNPPYGAEIDAFMRRAIQLLRRDNTKLRLVAFIARHELDCASGRTEFFKDCPEYLCKLVLTWRPRWIKGSKGSPRHNYAIYVWARRGTYGFTKPFTDYLVKVKR